MASGTKSLPFLGLNEDILLYIFSLNARAAESFISSCNVRRGYLDPRRLSAALNTTRSSSQVCREWRRLILESPTLWANSLDLEVLACGSDDWQNEVVRRTGNCLLTVVGTIGEITLRERSMLEFLDMFLDENWTRIRRLLVNDYFYDVADWKELLKRPTPNLERLRIAGDEYFQDIDDGTLFSGTSPRCLVEFQARFRLTLDPVHPWYTNLRHIHDFCVDRLSASELLHNLKLLPHLETLGIANNFFDYELDRPLTSVHMPNLAQLQINSNIMTMIPILKYLVPGPNCSLRFDDWVSNPWSLPEIITSHLDIGGALSTFLRHQSYQNRTFLEFHYYDMSGQFNIRDGCEFFDITLEDDQTINSNHSNDWADFVSQINAALSPLACSVLQTTTLHLGVHWLPSPSDSMLAFFDHFKNVSILKTDLKTIHIIGQAVQTRRGGEPGRPTLFPSVRHIVVYSWQSYDDVVDTKALYAFVNSRKDYAVPIEKISFEGRRTSTIEETVSWRALSSELGFEVDFATGAIHEDHASDSEA